MFLKIPNVHGSIFHFDGQVTVFNAPGGGPCYRCLYPEPPPPELAPSCAEAGVLGAICGIIGTLQAVETIKVCSSSGELAESRILSIDVLQQHCARAQDPQGPELRRLQRPPDHHRAHRLRAVLRGDTVSPAGARAFDPAASPEAL